MDAMGNDDVDFFSGGNAPKLRSHALGLLICYPLEESHDSHHGRELCQRQCRPAREFGRTVQPHDMYRCRTFKTLTTPTRVQFLTLATDPYGEIFAAGSTDSLHKYAWNLQTGKLIHIFRGHAEPVCSLTFQATGGTLMSASWDGTLKLWDLYKGNVPTESLQHTSDVVCVAFRPDGR
jgi:WD40 repeat protein